MKPDTNADVADLRAKLAELERIALQLSETEKRLNATQCEAMNLRAELRHYRWRPIAEIHEDYGPCVLMDIDDPGSLEIGSVNDLDFDDSNWTHFTEVPKLTYDEATLLRDALARQESKRSEAEGCNEPV
jgi:hypothetical protein